MSKTCVICGKEFTPKYNNNQKIYCSTECYRQSIVSILGNVEYKKIIMERDGNKCVMCQSIELLEVHHVKTKLDGGSDMPSNLVTLCYSCHRQLHKEFRKLNKQNSLTMTKLTEEVKGTINH